jgi:fatty-acid desaturase
MKITYTHLVRIGIILTHLTFFIGLYFAFKAGVDIIHYMLLGTFVGFWISILGVNVGMHRLISHRSFKTHIIIERILSILGCLNLTGSPLAWAAAHRQHHKAADKPGDVHSIHQGLRWWNVWFHVGLPVSNLSVRTTIDISSDPFQRFLHNHYVAINAIFAVFLTLLNPWYLVFIWAWHGILVFHAIGGINVIGHVEGWGRRYFDTDDYSNNSVLVQILTLGEGWHNTHHKYPGRWNTAIKWWELDPPAWIIWLIKTKD